MDILFEKCEKVTEPKREQGEKFVVEDEYNGNVG